jgi:hypothetical protein
LGFQHRLERVFLIPFGRFYRLPVDLEVKENGSLAGIDDPLCIDEWRPGSLQDNGFEISFFESGNAPGGIFFRLDGRIGRAGSRNGFGAFRFRGIFGPICGRFGTGLWLRGDGLGGFTPAPVATSGFLARGQVAEFGLVTTTTGLAVLVANTDDSLRTFVFGDQ